MNKCTIIGNLTKDPELRTTPNGISVCNFDVAVNRRFSNEENKVDYFRVTAWRQLGEICNQYLSKGRKVAVVGAVSAKAYLTKDNNAGATLEITADEIEFLTPRSDNTQQPAYNQTQEATQQANGYQPQYRTQQEDPSKGWDQITDSDLPF